MAKKIFLKTSIVLLSCFLFACSKQENNQNVQLKQISSKELKEKIAKQEEEFTLIDLRSTEKFHKEKIEGAVNIPIDSLKSKISNEEFWQNEYMYPPEDTSLIIIYGANSQTGIRAAKTLMNLGFNNVVYLKGGYDNYNIKRDKLL
ncbi:MAG: rhodanese-like domain-containing protein [Bacteroidales bacterium]|nr:rhodanese-like domain-containing protein [Bacteroidales bacterium]